MALVSGRFKLDPRAPEPARPAVPPLAPPRATAPPAPRPAPPPAPRPAAVAKAPARTNRKLLLIGAAVVALLLVGGAVFVATALGYPDKYVLDEDEMPAGMSNEDLSASDLREAGMRENPGEIDWDRSELADAFSQAGIDDPEEAHGQVLDAGSSEIVILALKYPNEEDARSAAQSMRRICSFGSAGGVQALVMRDGDVVVAIVSDDGASRAQVQAVGEALREKASGLERACST